MLTFLSIYRSQGYFIKNFTTLTGNTIIIYLKIKVNTDVWDIYLTNLNLKQQTFK